MPIDDSRLVTLTGAKLEPCGSDHVRITQGFINILVHDRLIKIKDGIVMAPLWWAESWGFKWH